MKTKTILLTLFILLIILGCNNKKMGINGLVGEWGSGVQTELTITKQDTTVMGVLNQPLTDYTQNQATEYPIGCVLLKNIKKISDSTFTAKGLYIKPIYRMEEVFVRSYFTFQKDHYETIKVFDHNENIYVDYRLELIENTKPIPDVTCSILKCFPFIEGPKWVFIGGLSTENKKRFLEKRVNDSTQVADSMVQVIAKQQRIADSISNAIKTKRANELLK